MKSRSIKLDGFFSKYWYLFVVLLITISSTFVFFRKSPETPPKIKASSSSEYLFEAKNKFYEAKIGASQSSEPFVSFNSAAGGSVAFNYDGVVESSVEQKDDSVVFTNVDPNTNIIYTPLPNGIKEEIIIEKPVTQSNYTFNLVTKNAYPRKNLDGSYSRFFFGDDGLYQFHLEKPFAIDAKGARTEDVVLKIRQSKDDPNTYQLNVETSTAWLSSPDRSYPVTIDPTIVYDTKSEVSAGTFNRLYDGSIAPSSTPAIIFNTPFYTQSIASDPTIVGSWYFNETANDTCAGGQDVCDSSGNGNHGIISGATGGPVLSGQSLNFSGGRTGAAAMTSGNQINIVGDITVELYFEVSSGSVQTLVHKDGQFSIQLDASNNFYWADSSNWSYANFGATNIGIASRNPYYLAVTKKDGIVRVYLNGEEKAAKAFGGKIIGTNNIFHIGCYSNATVCGSAYFNGYMSYVRVSNVAKTAEEIRNNVLGYRNYGVYTSDVIDFGSAVSTWNWFKWNEISVKSEDGETPANSTNLISQWKMNEVGGTTLGSNAGSCGGVCDGTLTGFTDTTGQDVVVNSGWTSQNSRYNGAIEFDGANDTILLGGESSFDFDRTNPFSVEAWVKLKGNGVGVIVSKMANSAPYAGYEIFTYNGQIYFLLNSVYSTNTLQVHTSETLEIGKWYKVVVTYSGNSLASGVGINVNGVSKTLVTDMNTLTGSTLNNNSVYLGSRENATFFFKGVIDDVRIYTGLMTNAISNYRSNNIEFQTRVGNTADPNDGSWEEWRPLGAETSVDSFEGTNEDLSVYNNTFNQTWTKYNNTIEAASNTTGTNGRIPLGVDGTGDDFYVGTTSLIKDGATYKTWYVGHDGTLGWRIFYATSPDGLTWTKYNNTIEAASNTTGTNGRIPLGVDGTGDDANTFSPSVIKDGSTYKMWYSGYDGANFRIFYATSPDGLTWTKYNNTIEAASNTTGTNGRIPLGVDGTGDDFNTAYPSVIKDGSTYKMWYAGNDGVSWRIFYATSPDGLTWTKYNNAIESASDKTGTQGRIPLGLNSSGDDGSTSAPSVIKDGSTYKMWYGGQDGLEWRIYYATSYDGLTWKKFDNNIPADSDGNTPNGRVAQGVSGGDTNYTFTKTVIKDGSTYKMWYGGFNGSNTRVFHATMSPTSLSVLDEGFIKTDGQLSKKITVDLPVDAGVVGKWKLDETGGTGAYLKDTARNTIHGTPTGTSVVNGISGKARYFNGSSDYIDLGDPSSVDFGSGNFSLEAWVKRDSVNGVTQQIISKDNTGGTTRQFFLAIFNTNKIRLFYATAGDTAVYLDSLDTITDSNKWHHIVGQRNGNSLEIYIDGKLSASGTTTGTHGAMQATATPLRIGQRPYTGNNDYFSGAIDEVKISNVARTPEEISETYRLGSNHYLNKSLENLDLSPKTNLLFNVAADRPGTYLHATIGESAYANYQPDKDTVGLWHLDDDIATYPRSCYALKLLGNNTDGIYYIDPDGDGPDSPLQVYCNMTYDGGGWTMAVKSWYGSNLVGKSAAVGAVTDATTLKGNAYKLSDKTIRNIIGPSNNFDVMADQNGYNSAYSAGNKEFVVIRNYTGHWTYERAMAASATTTTFQSYRITDQALAWTGNITCGYDGANGNAGLNCHGGLGVTNNPQGGAGCTINMGTASNAGWYHFFMNHYNDDTYLYICNGAQHSSGQSMNHRFWVRERKPVTAVTRNSASGENTLDQISATGGTISYVNGYTIHTFTTSGTFTVTKGSGDVEVLVVGGGGGGGMDMGGGGGGGGVIRNTGYAVTPQAYTVTVGLGGAGGPAGNTNGQPAVHQFTQNAREGGNSVFGNLTAIGGGYGGSSHYAHYLGGIPSLGGSGGGASGYSSGAGVTRAGGAGTAGQGNAGGQGGAQYYSGGGGGAGTAGTNSTGIAHGGSGIVNGILGTQYYWGGGGGGAGYSICGGNGGSGGGGGAAVCTTTGGGFALNSGSAGAGGVINAQTNKAGGNGGANTGGGGGGGSHYNLTNKGGDGGSGIVVIKYKNQSYLNGNSTVHGALIADGKIGNSRYFNGTSDYINIGDRDDLDLVQNYTVDAWIKPTVSGNSVYRMILAKRLNYASTNYQLYLNNNAGANAGELIFYNGNDGSPVSYSTGFVPPVNQWSHIAAVVSNSTNLKIYANGTLVYTATISPSQVTSGSLVIGKTGEENTNYFQGYIDEVRISNKARTAEEIAQTYDAGARTHKINIDFAARLVSTNLVTDNSDFGFNIDATHYGVYTKGGNIFPGEKIILRENYNGTEYKAQGLVNSVSSSTGAITVTSWDNGSTFPPSGFGVNADVFKWQKEYWNIDGEALDSHINAVTNLSLRFANGNEARNVYIDDIRTGENYLTTPDGSTITSSTGSRYMQYRSIFTTWDSGSGLQLKTASISATTVLPEIPTNLSGTVLSSSSIRWNYNEDSVNEDGFKLYDSAGNFLSQVVANTTDITETGLLPNTQYIRKVAAFNTYGNTAYTPTVSKYTFANVPSPISAVRSATSSQLTLGANSNSAATTYAVYKEIGTTCDGVGGSYISTNGADNGSTPVWATLANWGTNGVVTATGLNQERIYSFCVKAKNQDDIETAFSVVGKTSGEIAPISGDATIDPGTGTNTSFLTRYRDGSNPSRFIVGLDNVGAANKNSSVLNLASGSLVINSDETLVAGSLNLTGGSIYMATSGARIAPGAKLWAVDRDLDGYPDTTNGEIKLWYGDNPPTYGRRKSLLTTLVTADCNDNSYNTSNICCSDYTYYLDSDGDGYGSTTANVVCQETPSVPPGYANNNTDCNDSSNQVWMNLAQCHTDADGDTYTAGLAANTTCRNAANCSDTTKASASTNGAGVTTYLTNRLRTAASSPLDCYDANANANPGSTTCSTAHRGDGSYDYNCSATSTKCGTNYTLVQSTQQNYPTCYAFNCGYSNQTVYVAAAIGCGQSGYSGCAASSTFTYACNIYDDNGDTKCNNGTQGTFCTTPSGAGTQACQ